MVALLPVQQAPAERAERAQVSGRECEGCGRSRSAKLLELDLHDEAEVYDTSRAADALGRKRLRRVLRLSAASARVAPHVVRVPALTTRYIFSSRRAVS